MARFGHEHHRQRGAVRFEHLNWKQQPDGLVLLDAEQRLVIRHQPLRIVNFLDDPQQHLEQFQLKPVYFVFFIVTQLFFNAEQHVIQQPLRVVNFLDEPQQHFGQFQLEPIYVIFIVTQLFLHSDWQFESLRIE
jgi:hypothetical protein